MEPAPDSATRKAARLLFVRVPYVLTGTLMLVANVVARYVF